MLSPFILPQLRWIIIPWGYHRGGGGVADRSAVSVPTQLGIAGKWQCNPANHCPVSELGISSPNSFLMEEVRLLVATRFLLHIISFRWQFPLAFYKKHMVADYVVAWWLYRATFGSRQRIPQHPQATETLFGLLLRSPLVSSVRRSVLPAEKTYASLCWLSF